MARVAVALFQIAWSYPVALVTVRLATPIPAVTGEAVLVEYLIKPSAGMLPGHIPGVGIQSHWAYMRTGKACVKLPGVA